MTPQNQVVSLELSKRLKELGVKQESLFWWYQSNYLLGGTAGSGFVPRYEITQLQYPSRSNENKSYTETIPTLSAFTVAELGEMLPARITNPETRNMDRLIFYLGTHKGDDSKQDVRDGFTVEYHTMYHVPLCRVKADSEANARAKMLIYLLENKLIDLENP